MAGRNKWVLAVNLRLSAHFQTIASLLWPWFLIWTGLALVVMPFEIDQNHLRQWISNPGLVAALLWLLRAFDVVWIILAASVTYFETVSNEGLGTARRWAGRIVVGSAVLAWVGVATGFPFGPFVYTDHLGFRIGHVLPFTVPFLWLVLILCSRYTVLALRPNAASWPKWRLAFAIATLVLLSDINLEGMVWHTRFYWIWYPGAIAGPNSPPLQNFVSWWGAAFLFSLSLGLNPVSSKVAPRSWKPVIILAVMNALFLIVHLAVTGLR